MKSSNQSEYDLYTGIGIIDSQHQTFLTILKKIRTCNPNKDPETLNTFIDELHLYTLYHFETEEKLLEEYGVANLSEHKDKHQLLVDKIEEFRILNMTDSCVLGKSICEFLEEWLFEHIYNTDKKDFDSVLK